MAGQGVSRAKTWMFVIFSQLPITVVYFALELASMQCNVTPEAPETISYRINAEGFEKKLDSQ